MLCFLSVKKCNSETQFDIFDHQVFLQIMLKDCKNTVGCNAPGIRLQIPIQAESLIHYCIILSGLQPEKQTLIISCGVAPSLVLSDFQPVVHLA
jgi:hypothetical protein